MRVLLVAVALLAAFLPALATPALQGQSGRFLAGDDVKVGNVIFLHACGTGMNTLNLGRTYWAGPDDREKWNWDQIPEMAVYRAHMKDQLVGTHNGGATIHAFGYKVDADSFGQDGDRSIKALSGFPGSILREAQHHGMPTALTNDGSLAVPGTGSFTSEVDPEARTSAEIVRQIVDGRPGFENKDFPPEVLLAGGESLFLPEGTPECGEKITHDCFVHKDPVSGAGPQRTDGRNLIRDLANRGYTVIRTRQEFDELLHRIESDPHFFPKVLGLFARGDTFNGETEEQLIEDGLVIEERAGTKEGRLLLFGGRPGTRSFNPPSAAELGKMALLLIKRFSNAAGKPFFAALELESTDDFPNIANGIGTLNAVKRADDLIGVVRDFFENVDPHSFGILPPVNDAGGPQLFIPIVDDEGKVTITGGNPSLENEPVGIFPLDGFEGRNTLPFESAPNAFGFIQKFAIGYVGTEDVHGAILARAGGINAHLLRDKFSVFFDNTDVYRLMYLSLFGKFLPESYGQNAPDRDGH